MTEKWVLFNGTICLEKEALIPVIDRGFLFGEGIFTTIRVHEGRCELFNEHIHRLKKQSEELQFEWNPLQIKQISELIQCNGAGKGTWRLKIIITVKREGLYRKEGCIIATLDSYEEGSSSTPCHLCRFPYPLESPLAHIKSLSYIDHLFVRDFAHRQSYDDAITCTHEGFLLETGCSNLFWIDQGKCWIPDPQLPYLKGVFLQAILPHLTLPIQYVKTKMDQLPASASVYICNSLTHVRPVLSIDHLIFPRSHDAEELIKRAIDLAL